MHKDMAVLKLTLTRVYVFHRRFVEMKHYGDELQSVISQLLRVRAVSINKVKTAEYAAFSLQQMLNLRIAYIRCY